MKRKIRAGTGGALRVLVAALLLFSACVDVDVTTRIGWDGNGEQVWKFSSTALLSNQLRNQVESSQLFKKKNVQITDEYKEGDYILTVRLPFEKVEELSDETRDLSLERSGFFVNRYVFTERWKRDLGAAGILAKQTRSLAPVEMKVSVELPGKILETDANHFEGSVARWDVPINDLATSKTMRAVSSSWNLYAIVPTILLFSGGIIAGGLWFVARNRKTQLTPRCSACGAVVPQGSTFCNSCGVKL